MANEPKFQHYVPRFQLRYLTDKKEQLYVYDRVKNEIRKQSLNSVAGVNKIYTYVDKEGKEHTEVEEVNAQTENIAAPIVKNLHSGKKKFLTGQEKADLSVLLALNWLRTPAQIEKTKLMMEAGITMRFRTNALDKERFFKQVDELEKKTGKDFGDREKLRQSMLNNRTRIGFPNLAYLQSILFNLLELAEEIQKMAWWINVIKDKKSFLIPDINFTVENPNADARGLLVPGTQSMCILTNKVAIAMQPNHVGEKFVNPDLLFVRSCNIINAVRCQRFLFSNSEALLKSIVTRTKLYNIPIPKIGVQVYSGLEEKEFIFTSDDIKESK